MNREELIDLHPQLFHMAEAGSWPAIQKFGLLPTESIVRSSNLDDVLQSSLLNERRPESVQFDHPDLGAVVIRDQGPLNLTLLRPKLIDVTVEEWLHTLNNRVFFWLHPMKLEKLLTARRYRNSEQDVLTVDTRSLLNAVGDQVRLSPINSGASLYNPTPRGTQTFTTIEEYDYSARRKARGRVDAIIELAVIGGVPDISDHVTVVRRMRGTDELGEYNPS